MSQISSGPLAVAKLLIHVFSGVGQRGAPSPEKTIHIRLVTLAASHYCEKTRFMLDMLEDSPDNPYYYTEDAHPPPFHAYHTLPLTNGESSITPLLKMDEKTLICSDQSAKELMPSLYPSAILKEIEEVEHDLGVRLGAAIRCVGYHGMLVELPKYHSTMVRMSSKAMHTSKIENVLFDKMLDKGINKGIWKGLSINDENAAASEQSIRQVFAEVSAKLEKNKSDYLMDTPSHNYGLTAADIAFAALAFPLLRPPEMKNFTILDDEMPPPLFQLYQDMVQTRAGQYALTIYKKHRVVDPKLGIVLMKTVRRDRYPWEHRSVKRFGSVVLVAAAAAFAWQQQSGNNNNGSFSSFFK